ncbi:MAG: T9SS type A sorting domain-containing protein [Bacteroidota bacterium]
MAAIIGCLSSNTLLAQNPCYEYFPMGQITGIQQDFSYLYIGTESDGLVQLNKSSGTIEQIYTPSNSSLDSLHIESIIRYRQNIVLSTGKHLFKLDRITGLFLILADSISGLLARGRTYNHLYVVDDRDMYLLENDSVIYHQDLTQIVPDACCSRNTSVLSYYDDLWISHHDFYEFDILRFDGTNWEVYGDHNSILPVESFQHNALSIWGDRICASHWGGIDSYNSQTGQWTSLHKPSSGEIIVGTDTLKNNITTIGQDRRGGYWVGMDPLVQAKLAYFDGNEWAYLNDFSPDSFTTHVIDYSYYIDGVTYFGTSEGLLIIDKKCLGLLSANEASIEAGSVQISPNPAQQSLQVKWADLPAENWQLKVYDLAGRLVWETEKYHSSAEHLILPDLAINLYQVQIQMGDRFISQKMQLGW